MRVVVDFQAFALSAADTGASDRYPATLVGALLRHAGHHDVEIVVSHSSEELLEELRGKFPNLFGHRACHLCHLPFLNTAEANTHWHRAATELVREHGLLQLKPDVVLCVPLTGVAGADMVTQLRCSDVPTALALSGWPTAMTPKNRGGQGVANSPAAARKAVYLAQPRQFELVLTASEYSKRLLLQTLELPADRVVVIPPGVAERLPSAAVGEAQALAIRRRFVPNQDFILSIGGGADPAVEPFLEAYGSLPPEVRRANRLLLVGIRSGDEIRRVREVARSSGLADDEFALAGDTSDDELAALYSKCKLVVVCGSEEVAVHQALDAMSCGTPVLGPDQFSFPEVLGLSEALFDPASARHLSAKLNQALAGTEFREKLKAHAIEQARRFSWQASARRSLEALETLRSSRSPKSHLPGPSSQRVPRMAYVSPLPPERSGIADYSAELLPELAKHYEIDLITDLPQLADPFLEERFARVSFRRFEQSARDYERILYHVGNSPLHSRAPSLVEHYPGVVVLHDFFLSHLFKYLEGLDGLSLWRNLYVSHGYSGLLTRAREGADAAVWSYPCSLAVQSGAAGIIVHSEHARQLAEEWFGIPANNCKVIPQLRRLPRQSDRREARRKLGIPSDAFLVCSFGFFSPAKLNDLILRSWLGSNLARLPTCYLVFVGGDAAGDPYQVNGLASSQIRATGYVSKEDYELYLAAADVGVQLRSELSRGETPRSVLDCMAYGVAAIVSSHPALTDLPADAVLRLSRSCGMGELIAAFERLHSEPKYRAELGRHAQRHVQTHRTPALIADHYAEAVEEFARDHPIGATRRISAKLGELAARTSPSDQELATVASCMAEHHRRDGMGQLLVDITVLVSLGDLKTGIHRTTRGILNQLLRNPPRGWRVEPVFRRQTYRYARKFVSKHLGLYGFELEDAPVAVNPGDVFLGLDWDPGISVDDRAANWLLHHRQRGMRTVFTIYDVLPLQHSEWFKPDMQPVFQGWLATISRIADSFACISRAVADDLISWLDGYSPLAARAIDIGYFHLGSDIEASSASRGLASDEQKILDLLKGREVLLMVGTVEPRKGHIQALSAMEHLWAAGEKLSLVICGQQGWMVDSIAQRLRSHSEVGRRFFWMEQATDEALMQLYSIASAILMASEGEGFGLPLVEAAHRAVPIITRDLAVFREVAGEHAFYFSGADPADLAAAIRNWLELYRRGEHPKSSMMPRLTWQQSTDQLMQLALAENVYRRWQRRPNSHLGPPVPVTITNEHVTRVPAAQNGSVKREFEESGGKSGAERLGESCLAGPENLPSRANRT
jgi:glycosyltransferase involved in cell wall biosynthesis